MSKTSSQRLYQSAWTILSIYFGILLADVAGDSLVPLVLDPNVDKTRWWVVPPTMTLFVLSAFEAYLWLNPQEDRELKPPLARFLGARLIIYVAAVVAQMFLLKACTDFSLAPPEAFSIWSGGMAAVTGLYFLYNILGLIWPHGASQERIQEYWQALLIYAPFVAAFTLVSVNASWFAEHPNAHGFVVSAIAFAYFVSYFFVWWKWYAIALSSDAPPKPLAT